ncbi:MAG: L-rhamnonate dehydratase [Verrucomicrobiales bacterium]|jgi:L-rhamnonate dehydratase
MNRITSVRAAAVTNPAALGRAKIDRWHDEIDHMNPLASDGRYGGQSARFEPPWGETICVITVEDGTWGIGMTALSGLTVPMINDYFAPMLVGDDASDVERLWQMMTTASGAHFGTGGGASYAISAVDLALWDLRGKQHGQPVFELIAGERASSLQAIPCYATGLDLEAYRDLGFEAFKLACPWGPDLSASLDRTIELVERSRSIVGATADLMLDCWGVHSPDEAVAIGEAVRGYGLGWIEDFIFPEDWAGYEEVRRRLPDLTLAAGERWYTDRPFQSAIEHGWVDIVQPDALWVGGATPTIIIAEMAAEAEVGLSVHCGGNDSYGQHLSYSLPGSLWAETYIGPLATNASFDSYRSTPGMARPASGYLEPSDAPGFGIELTLTDIERATR